MPLAGESIRIQKGDCISRRASAAALNTSISVAKSSGSATPWPWNRRSKISSHGPDPGQIQSRSRSPSPRPSFAGEKSCAFCGAFFLISFNGQPPWHISQLCSEKSLHFCSSHISVRFFTLRLLYQRIPPALRKIINTTRKVSKISVPVCYPKTRFLSLSGRQASPKTTPAVSNRPIARRPISIRRTPASPPRPLPNTERSSGKKA